MTVIREPGFYLETIDFEKKFEMIIKEAGEKLAAQGVYAAGTALLDAADNEPPQTPQELGNLRALRLVKDPEIVDGRISVQAGYNTPYAAYQHEGQRKDGSHKVKNYTTDIVAQPGAKFLESKMVREPRRFMAIVADYIRRALGGSSR